MVPTAAGYGAAWLADRLDEQIPMENFGSPDWGVTLDAALGMAAAGSGGEQIDAVWASFVANRDDRGRLRAASTITGSPGPGDPARPRPPVPIPERSVLRPVQTWWRD